MFAQDRTSQSHCAGCGVAIDPLRSPVRVAQGRLASVCTRCAATNDGHAPAPPTTEESAARLAPCTCGALVEIHTVRPIIAADGSVRYRCSACSSEQPQPAQAPAQSVSASAPGPAVELAQPSGWPYWRLGVVVAAAAVVAVAAARSRTAPAPAAVARFFAPSAHAADEHLQEAKRIAGNDAPRERKVIIEEIDDVDTLGDPDVPTVEDVLESSDESLEELLPTLADWVHPVPGSSEEFPLKSTRRFGARRDGVNRRECGRGHCGVDLDGPRGTPVVSVAWGTVARIQRSSHARSGKYVRIEHPDFVYTSYMHLDSIPRDLEVGDEVNPGDVIGTLGRSGIMHSAPHLHFSVEIPRDGALVYIDPEPYLRRAAQLDEMPEMPSMGDSAETDADSEPIGESLDAHEELPAD